MKNNIHKHKIFDFYITSKAYECSNGDEIEDILNAKMDQFNYLNSLPIILASFKKHYREAPNWWGYGEDAPMTVQDIKKYGSSGEYESVNDLICKMVKFIVECELGTADVEHLLKPDGHLVYDVELLRND